MFRSVISDLSFINTIEWFYTRDERLPELKHDAAVAYIKAGDDPYAVWQDHLLAADASIIIAPETNQVLYDLIALSERCQCPVMGCSISAVEIASSKFKSHRLLREIGVDSPDMCRLDKTSSSYSFPCVLKPDDGVGAENCYLTNNDSEFNDAINKNPLINNWIVQDYIGGEHASITIICYQQEMMLLAVNKQIIDIIENKVSLTGLEVNGLFRYKSKAEEAVQTIVNALPGLEGIIGVDCVFTQDKTYVVDINPRFTTSYSGLAQSIGFNPMRYLIDLFMTQSLPKKQHQQHKSVCVDLAS